MTKNLSTDGIHRSVRRKLRLLHPEQFIDSPPILKGMKQFDFVRTFVICLMLTMSSWAYSQTFIFEFKGPDTLYVNQLCEVPLTLDMDSLSVLSDIGANVIDTTLVITGQYMLGDNIPAGTVVTFNWIAKDDMGNDSTFVFTITAVDTLTPNFSSILPVDITVNCDNIPNPPVVTFFDNCDPNPSLSYEQGLIAGTCNGDFILTREWIIKDFWGNSRNHIQMITVIDNVGPVISGVPNDTTVLCHQIPLPPTGNAVSAADNCGPAPMLSFQESTFIGTCTDAFTIVREWTAEDDCGNVTTATQTITVIDTLAPVLSGIPSDITVSCDAVPLPPVIGVGGVTASDNCDATPILNFIQNTTQDTDPSNCDHYNYTITRTWITIDNCSNLSARTQTIAVRDMTPPTLYCPGPDTFYIQPGPCLISGAIANLVFATDNCVPSGTFTASDTLDIVNTSGTPLLSGVVDNAIFQFAVTGLPGQYVTGNVSLAITLLNADAEQPGEYYIIIGENNTFLGKTDPTPAQCASGITTIVNLTPEMLNDWGTDGTITITLVPEGDGVGAINEICAGGRVVCTLGFDYAVSPPAGLTLQYRVDNGPVKNLIGGTEIVEPGDYTVTIMATDCSGNIDSCEYPVVVLDRIDPVLICPADLSVSTDPFDCNASFAMPFPVNVTDNCGFPTDYTGQVAPQSLVFFNDPNAGIVPEDVNVSFNQVPFPGTGQALLRVFLRADAADSGEFFEVYGEGNQFMGITDPSLPAQECTQESVSTFAIPYATIQSWANDGQVSFRLVSNKNVINFSDFIQPCGPLQPNNTDGISYVRFELSFNQVITDYTILTLPGGNQVAAGTLQSTAQPPMETLPIGDYTIWYSVIDHDANTSSCSWTLTIRDLVPPVTQCKPGFFVKTNPSGLIDIPLTSQAMLAEPASDNCGISHYEVEPALISCQQAGSNVQARLITYDISGNTDTCFSIVAIQNEELTPMFSLDTCGKLLRLIPDTTFTIPTPGSGNFFVYTWTGPNSYFSNQAYPVISNPGASEAGTYILTVQGLTGCQSTGSVNVNIDLNGAFRPSVSSNSPVCQGDSIQLSTSWVGAFAYEWTHESTGTVYNTGVPSLTMEAIPANAGQWTLKVIEDFNCTSEPSEPISITVHPMALQVPDGLVACQGDSIALPANGVNVGLYTWTSPSGMTHIGQNPIVDIKAGIYRVKAESPEGCILRDSIQVSIQPRPVITALSHSCPNCVSGTEECELVPTIFPQDTGGLYLYTWTNPLGMVFSVDTIGIISNANSAQSGLYTLRVEKLDNTCRSNPSSIFITLNDRPVTPIIGADGSNGQNPYAVCDGDEVVLQVLNTTYTGSVRYVWYGPLGIDTTTNASLVVPSIVINQGGSYTLEVIVNGCASNLSNTQVIQVKPKPLPPTITTNSPVCDGDSLIVCSSFIEGAQYEWSGPSGLGGPDNCLVFENANLAMAGEYIVRVSVDGCYSVFTEPEQVNVIARPDAPLITDNCGGSICRDHGQTCELQIIGAIPGTEYYWYAANPDTLLGYTGNGTILSLGLPGQYIDGTYGFYAIAEANGCRSLIPIIHSIQINTIPDQSADAGPDINICDGTDLILCAQQPLIGTGQWSQSAGPVTTIVQPEENCTSILGYQPGATMVFTWSLSNGACLNYASDQTSAVISRFESAQTISPVNICQESSATIIALPGQYGTGFWSQSPGQAGLGVTITTPLQPATSIQGMTPGNTYYFTWTLPNGACDDSEAIVAVNNFNDAAFAGTDRKDCGIGCLTLPLVAEFATLGQGIWFSPDPNIIITPTGETSATACGLRNGPNMFIWQLNEGICGESSRDTIWVNYTMQPIAVPDVVTVPFAGQSLINVLVNDNYFGPVTTTLTGLPGQGTMQKLAEGSYTYTPPIQFAGETQFTYRICSEECPDLCSEAVITLQVSVNNDCEVPTLITPNNDNVNDRLVIPCLADISKYNRNTLSVFNEWGDEVYRASPYTNDWEGTYNGRLLPAGTYFFVFEPGDGAETSTGFIIIKY